MFHAGVAARLRSLFIMVIATSLITVTGLFFCSQEARAQSFDDFDDAADSSAGSAQTAPVSDSSDVTYATENAQESLPEETAAPDESSGTLGSVTEPVGQTLGTVTEPVGQTLGNVAEPVGQTLGGVTKPVSNDVIEPVGEAVLAPVSESAGRAASPLLETANPVIEPVASGTVEPVASGVIEPTLAPVKQTVEPVTYVVEENILAPAKPALSPIATTVNATRPVTESVEKTLRPTQPVVAPIVEAVVGSDPEPASPAPEPPISKAPVAGAPAAENPVAGSTENSFKPAPVNASRIPSKSDVASSGGALETVSSPALTGPTSVESSSGASEGSNSPVGASVAANNASPAPAIFRETPVSVGESAASKPIISATLERDAALSGAGVDLAANAKSDASAVEILGVFEVFDVGRSSILGGVGSESSQPLALSFGGFSALTSGLFGGSTGGVGGTGAGLLIGALVAYFGYGLYRKFGRLSYGPGSLLGPGRDVIFAPDRPG